MGEGSLGNDPEAGSRPAVTPLRRFVAWLRLDPATHTPIELESGPPEYKPETVEALVDEAKFHASFEESRLDAVNQRASWLLAFDAILVGLGADEARSTLAVARGLGAVGRPLAAISLLVGVGLVVVSAVLALTVVFRAKSWVWTEEDIGALESKETVQSDRGFRQGIFLRGLVARIQAESSSYAHLRRRLNIAFGALTAALVAIAIHIGVFAVRTLDNPCPLTLGQPSAAIISPALSSHRLVAYRLDQITVTTTSSSSSQSPFPRPGCPGTR